MPETKKFEDSNRDSEAELADLRAEVGRLRRELDLARQAGDLIQDAPEAFSMELDDQGRLRRLSRDPAGRPVADLLGRPLSDCLPAEMAPELAAALAAAAASGDTVTLQGAGRLADGSPFRCRLRLRALTTEGRLAGYAVLLMDPGRSATTATAAEEGRAGFRDIFDHAGVGLAQMGLDGHYLSANQRFLDLLGYSASELAHITNDQIILPDDMAECWPRFGRLTSGEIDDYTLEFRYRRKDGQVRWGRGTMSLLRDREGRPAYLIATLEDITEQRRMQVELAQAEAFHRSVLEGVGSGILVTDAGDNITFANRAMARLAGLAVEELEGRNFFRDFQPEGLGEAWERYRRARQGLEPVRYDAITVRRPDGTQAMHAGWLIPRVESGRFQGMICTVNDVTRREQAIAALKRSERLFQLFMDNLPGPAFISDTKGCSVFRNQTLVEIMKGSFRPGSERVPLSDVYTKEVADYFMEQDRQVMAKGRPMVFEEHLPELTGDRAWLTYKFPLPDDLGPGLVGGIALDVTDRKILEKQLRQAQKMEAIGTLAGGVAHDFNNLVYAILGFAELAQDQVSPQGEPYRYLEEIRGACRRAARLTRELLTFARRGISELKPLSLAPVVKEALQLLGATVPAHVEVERRINAREARIKGDPTLIHQVIMNLGTNALHAVERDGGRIVVSLDEVAAEEGLVLESAQSPGRPVLRLRVSDNGSGIPPDLMDRIFDPFFTTKPQGKGTGLGLAVVMGIVESLGGSLRVHSQLGQGAAFDIFLPTVSEASGPEEPEPDALKAQPGTGRVMVVEDEEPIARMLEGMLTALGYRVTTFLNPRQALGAFRQDPGGFDLVITDQTMPELTGDRLVRELLAIRPGLPIVLCTGHSELINSAQAKAIGVREYVRKPIELRRLAAMVRSCLSLDEPEDLAPGGPREPNT